MAHLIVASTAVVGGCSRDQNHIGSCGMERKDMVLLDWWQLYIEWCPACSLILCPVMCLALGKNVRLEKWEDTYIFL